MAKTTAVKQAVTDFGQALSATNTVTDVRAARASSQAFAADNDATNPDLADYIDLWDLSIQTQEAGLVLPGVGSALINAVDSAVVADAKSSGSAGGFYWDHGRAHG